MMKKKLLIILIPIITILLVISGIYFYHESTTLEVSHYEVSNSKITNDFNNFKIIQISDFHNTKNKKLVKSIITTIEEEKPNIIVITGDFFDPNKSHMSSSIDFIKLINKYAKVYYVTGNHEAYDDTTKYVDELRNNGGIVLDNKAEVIEINESKINILGIDDPKFYNGDEKLKNKEIIKREIESIDYNKDNYTILLSHRPEVFKLYAELNMDLVFSGHAHGGQFRIPFAVYAPHQGLFPKYTSGEYKKDNTTMIVSRGIGNGFPLRINNNPNLVVVTLKSA